MSGTEDRGTVGSDRPGLAPGGEDAVEPAAGCSDRRPIPAGKHLILWDGD
ncbi:MAG: hypothetical protein MJE77_46545 [Proteobacteria bacterium]|nr:hypothetical protein [Pseudomonadota bacterium]